jgi:hypothetical protein
MASRLFVSFFGVQTRRTIPKILAKVSDVFFQHRLGPAFAALMRDARVVACAIQANTQIRAATHASLAATRLAAQRPGFAAVVAARCHLNLRFAICDYARKNNTRENPMS